MPMSIEARKIKAAYMRQWRKNNPGKQRQYDEQKWERKAAAKRAASGDPGEQTA